MVAALLVLAALAFGPGLWAEGSGRSAAPSYSSASIVNSATNTAGTLAPNSLATIYGTNLAYSTRAVSKSDIAGGALPTTLAGVQLLVGGLTCQLYFVSPEQVNFLVPPLLRPGNVKVRLVREGLAGPEATITLSDAAPAFFQMNGNNVIAIHADGALINADAPARAGEIVVLFAVGLGRTDPDVTDGRIPTFPFPLRKMADLNILFDGQPVDRSNILYAGVTPGFVGLYQVNLKLPDELSADPEIRVSVGEQISPAAVKLPLQ